MREVGHGLLYVHLIDFFFGQNMITCINMMLLIQVIDPGALTIRKRVSNFRSHIGIIFCGRLLLLLKLLSKLF